MTQYNILETDYQRNGIGGEGFYTVRFTVDEHDQPLLAVIPGKFRPPDPEDAEVFDDTSSEGWQETYVIDPTDLTKHWRGDRIYDDLLAHGVWDRIKQDSNERFNRTLEQLKKNRKTA